MHLGGSSCIPKPGLPTAGVQWSYQVAILPTSLQAENLVTAAVIISYINDTSTTLYTLACQFLYSFRFNLTKKFYTNIRVNTFFCQYYRDYWQIMFQNACDFLYSNSML